MKCGQEKPHCHRCISTGRVCDGYETIRIAKASKGSTGEMVLRWEEPPSQYPTASHREVEAMYYFRESLLDCPCSTWDMSVWHRLVLPMSTNEPIVRHAVTALGSLSRPGKANDAFGLQQYSLAMKALRSKTAGVDDRSAQNLILVACLLFIAIELVQRGWEQAQSHLNGGLSIVKQIQQKPVSSSSAGGGPKDTLAPLEQLFGRLDNQMSLFTSSRVQLHRAMSNGRMAFLPAELRLKSVEDAGRLHSLQVAAMRELVYEIESQRFTPEGIEPANYVELEVQQGRQLVSLDRWHTAMEDLIPKLSDERDERLAKLLMMSHLCCRMMVSNALADGRETLHDRFMPEFERILELGEELTFSGTNGSRIAQRRFSLDIGIIAPVYYVALKCREPTLRRRAISLLKSSNSQEGAWDSATMADLAKRVLEVEEQGIEDPKMASDIPEQNRLWRAWFDLRSGATAIECMRRAWERDGEWIKYEVRFE